MSSIGSCASCSQHGASAVFAERARYAQASSQTKASVTLTTAEGDKVTLSFDSQDSREYVDYASRVRGGGVRGRAHAAESSRSSQVKVAVSVEGDLNSSELKDIQQLAKIMGSLAGDVAKGDADGAAKTAFKLGKLDSVAALQLNVSYTSQYQLGLYEGQARVG